DYPLQTPWMIGKFREDWGFVVPLAAHCAVHAAFTITIGFVLGWIPWLVVLVMGLFDFLVHFNMDRAKASKKWLGRFEPLNAYGFKAMTMAVKGTPIGSHYPVELAKQRLRSNRWYWHSLGIDQTVHHLTDAIIVLVYMLCLLP